MNKEIGNHSYDRELKKVRSFECQSLEQKGERSLSFASDGVAFCQLYLSTQTADTVVMRGGVSYYEKNENMVMQ